MQCIKHLQVCIVHVFKISGVIKNDDITWKIQMINNYVQRPTRQIKQKLRK